jgi:hypothetical protein
MTEHFHMVDNRWLDAAASDAREFWSDPKNRRATKELAARMLANRERKAALVRAVTAMRERRERERMEREKDKG